MPRANSASEASGEASSSSGTKAPRRPTDRPRKAKKPQPEGEQAGEESASSSSSYGGKQMKENAPTAAVLGSVAFGTSSVPPASAKADARNRRRSSAFDASSQDLSAAVRGRGSVAFGGSTNLGMSSIPVAPRSPRGDGFAVPRTVQEVNGTQAPSQVPAASSSISSSSQKISTQQDFTVTSVRFSRAQRTSQRRASTSDASAGKAIKKSRSSLPDASVLRDLARENSASASDAARNSSEREQAVQKPPQRRRASVSGVTATEGAKAKPLSAAIEELKDYAVMRKSTASNLEQPARPPTRDSANIPPSAVVSDAIASASFDLDGDGMSDTMEQPSLLATKDGFRLDDSQQGEVGVSALARGASANLGDESEVTMSDSVNMEGAHQSGREDQETSDKPAFVTTSVSFGNTDDPNGGFLLPTSSMNFAAAPPEDDAGELPTASVSFAAARDINADLTPTESPAPSDVVDVENADITLPEEESPQPDFRETLTSAKQKVGTVMDMGEFVQDEYQQDEREVAEAPVFVTTEKRTEQTHAASMPEQEELAGGGNSEQQQVGIAMDMGDFLKDEASGPEEEENGNQSPESSSVSFASQSVGFGQTTVPFGQVSTPLPRAQGTSFRQATVSAEGTGFASQSASFGAQSSAFGQQSIPL
ncbi:unnamed protein product, partial [Amoebophrya sp. A120]|eukprot:GSA120T00011376001.1